ncbi:MAG: FHA domain-containing protein [Akkermansia sp.]|nr:FHA domain-containing protein [Akkermansia sp.]
MKPYQHHSSIVAALCLLSFGIDQAAAAPVSLPSAGVNAEGLRTNALKLNYDPSDRKISFSAVSTNDYADISSCEAYFKKDNTTTLLPVENWKFDRNTPAIDLHVVIDESNSMRMHHNKRVYFSEAINVVTELVKTCGPNDKVYVHLVSSEMTLLGDSSDLEQLNNKLKQLANGAAPRKNHTHQRTAIFHHSCKLINSLPQKSADRSRKLLLLTDGEDDASAPGESEDLIAAASDAKKQIPISCITFFQAHAPRNTQVNTFERLCTKTQGFFVFQNSACSNTTAAAIANTLTRNFQAPGCSFTLNQPEKMEGSELQLKFNLPNNKQAHLSLTDKALKDAFQASINKEADILLEAILTRVSAATGSLSTLAEAEKKSPINQEEIAASINAITQQAEAVLSDCQNLKKLPIDTVCQSIDEAKKRQGLTEAEKNALTYLLNLQKNDKLKATQLTGTHMVQLLGRTTPMPHPGVDNIHQLLASIQSAAARLEALTQTEQAEAPDLLTVSRDACALRQVTESMLQTVKQLKNSKRETLERAMGAFLHRTGIPGNEQIALSRLQDLLSDTSLKASALTTEHMLQLIGRDTPLPNPEADTIKTLQELINSGTLKAAEFTKLEIDSPGDIEQMEQVLTELKSIVASMKEPATLLKQLPAETVVQTLQIELANPNTSETEKEVLNLILSYCNNSDITADNVDDAQLLLLLGRTTPLPEQPLEAPMPVWAYITIGISVLLLLLVSIWLYIRHIRRRRNKQNTQQNAGLPPLPLQSESPVKPAAVVEADTPGISPDSVLAILDDPDSDRQWWIIEPLVNVGRDSNNDLVLNPSDRTVSSRHCTIKRERDGSWSMYDLGTPNKIYYNNEVLSHVILTQGIIVELGSVKLRFHATNNNGNTPLY